MVEVFVASLKLTVEVPAVNVSPFAQLPPTLRVYVPAEKERVTPAYAKMVKLFWTVRLEFRVTAMTSG